MRASAAVVRGVDLSDPEQTCSVVDFPHEVSPGIEHLLRSAYLESLKLWPTAYGRIYRSSGGARPGSYRHYGKGRKYTSSIPVQAHTEEFTCVGS
jgi:hypothetical protein